MSLDLALSKSVRQIGVSMIGPNREDSVCQGAGRRFATIDTLRLETTAWQETQQQRPTRRRLSITSGLRKNQTEVGLP